MLTLLPNITLRLPVGEDHFHERLILPFDLRQKSRLRVRLASGREAALLLPRGTILRGGDRLQMNHQVVLVVAADEPVHHVTALDAQTLARAAYHLGNRHVPLQVGASWLRLEQDHVLKAMLVGLNVTVSELNAPFEPEAGAYGGGHRHASDSDNEEDSRAGPHSHGL